MKHRVPKVSVKKCRFTLNWHKCHFTPSPSSESEKLADLEVSSQVGKLNFRFQSAALPTPPTPSENDKLSRYRFQPATLHLPPPPPLPSGKLADLELSSQVGKLDFRFESATLPPPPTPPPHPHTHTQRK